MAVKKRVILAQRFFQAQKMLSPFAEEELRSRVKGRLRPYAAWRSAPFTRRRSDTLGVAVRAAVSRLLPCKLGVSAANFARFFTASNNKGKAIQPALALLKQQGLTLYFLPPYSPELNRIELLWHKVKYEWMAFKTRTAEMLEADVGKILDGE